MSTATENFDSYSNGATVNGLNGGSGWAGAWTEDHPGDWTISNTQSLTAPNAANTNLNIVANQGMTRVLASSVASGTASVSFWVDSNLLNSEFLAELGSGAQLSFVVNGSGSESAPTPNPGVRGIYVFSGPSFTYNAIALNFTFNTWHTIVFTFNAGTYTATFDGGAPVGPFTYADGSSTPIDQILVLHGNHTDNCQVYIDNISITPTATSFTAGNRRLIM